MRNVVCTPSTQSYVTCGCLVNYVCVIYACGCGNIEQVKVNIAYYVEMMESYELSYEFLKDTLSFVREYSFRIIQLCRTQNKTLLFDN